MPGKYEGMINVHAVDKKCSFNPNVTDATGANSQPVLFIMMTKLLSLQTALKSMTLCLQPSETLTFKYSHILFSVKSAEPHTFRKYHLLTIKDSFVVQEVRLLIVKIVLILHSPQ